MQEIWKDIPEFKGLYQASNFGRIKGLKRKTVDKNGKTMTFEEKILTPSISDKGYMRVNLYKETKHYCRNVHRLVAETFIPNNNKKPTVDHSDRSRLNNCVSNLRWATYVEQKHNTLYYLL